MLKRGLFCLFVLFYLVEYDFDKLIANVYIYIQGHFDYDSRLVSTFLFCLFKKF